MSFVVTIVRKADGHSVQCTDEDDWDEGSEFRWTEGNQACDCNRRGAFALAMGEPDPDYGECGDTDFFVVLPDGSSHPKQPRHNGACSNQNVLDPSGAYIGAAECGCNK